MCKIMKNKFPNIEAFNIALATMQKVKPTEIDDYIIYEIYPEQEQSLHNNKKVIQPSKNIYFRKDSTIQYESIVKKVKNYLNEIGHAANESIAQAILYCCCFIPRNNENAVDKINQMLSCVTRADINQYVVYPFANHFNYNLKINKFQVSTFEHLKFKRYCEKFGTDFYDLYGERLLNNLSIKKDYETISVLELPRITELGVIYNNQLNEALWFYFEELSKYYTNQFKFEFSESQNLMTFYHDDFIDVYEWSKLSPWQITIFLNMGSNKKEGWIIPFHLNTMVVDFAGSDIRNENLKKSLSDNFGKNVIQDITKNETINRFLEFSAKAKRHIRCNRINEGFLHFIIAHTCPK